MLNFLVGADPEIFMTRSGKLVSAHGAVSGTKYAPLPVDGGAVQVDGMALEFNVNPTNNADKFVGNINLVMSQLKSMLPDDADFLIEPTAMFGHKLIRAQPAEAKELGCEPDFNAYTREENPRPNADAPFRTASGHIHIGWMGDKDKFMSLQHQEECIFLVKVLDHTLGLASLVWDKDEKRRELYGNFGAFRYKPYGVEYRTLSNKWLASEAHIRCVFAIVEYVMKHIGSKISLQRLGEQDHAPTSFEKQYVMHTLQHRLPENIIDMIKGLENV